MAAQNLDFDVHSAFAANMLAAMPEAAMIVGADGRVAAANAPALQILPGVRLNDPVVLWLRAPIVLDAQRRVVAGGEAETVLWSERVPVERLFEVRVAPLSRPGGTAIATLMTLRDLTEQRKVERMRVDFIANASHELRTPLASMLGFVETLQGPARDDAKARERFLGIMRDQGRRMARLVDDLLSLSRIEQKQHLRPEAAVDLALVARGVADALGPLALEMGVELNVECADAVVVTGDRDELVRVAENLVENAIKYGAGNRPGTRERVEITVTKTERDGAFSVRDFGPGIAPEHLPRLTERFYRVDAGQSRTKNGTGLGLAIVKHILARHRGRLAIASRPNEGSVFTATAPLHPPQSLT